MPNRTERRMFSQARAARVRLTDFSESATREHAFRDALGSVRVATRCTRVQTQCPAPPRGDGKPRRLRADALNLAVVQAVYTLLQHTPYNAEMKLRMLGMACAYRAQDAALTGRSAHGVGEVQAMINAQAHQEAKLWSVRAMAPTLGAVLTARELCKTEERGFVDAVGAGIQMLLHALDGAVTLRSAGVTRAQAAASVDTQRNELCKFRRIGLAMEFFDWAAAQMLHAWETPLPAPKG